jgi:hypothetical protein
VPRGREAAHVGADLGEGDTSAQFVDTGNGGQEFDGGAKGLDIGVDLLIDPIDRRVDGIANHYSFRLRPPGLWGHCEERSDEAIPTLATPRQRDLRGA